MDFFTIVFLLCLYYVRPHEWIGLFKILPVVKLTFLLALLSLFHKHRGIRFSDVIKTPHDWMMLSFFAWMVFTSPSPKSTFGLVLPLFAFYVVAVVTLVNTKRLQTFLNWWTFWILVLAALAVAATFGFDPTESMDLTLGRMKGRLAFNTSIFNNANALGHSVVPAISMLYFVAFWRRPVFIKIATGILLLLPLYCVWLTVSKGAFLTGFATLLVAVTFRRPLGVQLFIVLFAVTLGWVAVQQLPRMQEISEAKSNVAIQGRVAAFQFGMETLNQKITGVGWAHFENEFYRAMRFHKAPHSSYVRVGGELGWPGMFLFMGLMYCCARTLMFANAKDDGEERIRRTLFVMLTSYAVSSWMVGWADRATFYLMVAAVSAFHRYLQSSERSSPAQPEKPASAVTVPPPPYAQPALLVTENAVTQIHPSPIIAVAAADQERPAHSDSLAEKWLETIAGIRWRRIGLVDLVLIFILTFATIQFWRYAMSKM